MMKTVIQNLITLIRTKDKTPATIHGLKLSEECGEMAEQLLNDAGYLKHKTKEFEGAMGEGADVIITTVCILTAHYDELEPEEVYSQLLEAIERKGNKYQNIIENR